VKQAAVRAIVNKSLDDQGRPRITTKDLVDAVPRLRAQVNPEKKTAGFT
jgi:hypothetical protein